MPEQKSNEQRLRKAILKWWLRWLFTLVFFSIVGLILLRLVRRYPEPLHTYFSKEPEVLRFLAKFLATFSLTWILAKLLSPRLSHLKAFRLHPPIWAAILLAVLLVCLIDLVGSCGTSEFKPLCLNWILLGLIPIVLVPISQSLLSNSEPDPKAFEAVKVLSFDDLAKNENTLISWLKDDKPSPDDILGTSRIAQKLANFLKTQGGSVGLLGPFGSGKSNLVKWIIDEANQHSNPDTPELWFTIQSCWGFEDSGSAIQKILDGTIEALNKRTDSFSLRHLPESYRKVFSAGGEWARSLLDLFVPSDPLSQFRHLSEILLSQNARLVLVIEDLDRSTSSKFDRQEILALLQRLRETSDRISFVLAAGQAASKDIDFAKLCDHIEILPDFDSNRVAEVIQSFRAISLRGHAFLPTNVEDTPWNNYSSVYLLGVDHLPLSRAAALLMSTPRNLKQALRRTQIAWQKLKGEIDFDHLLAVNFLRCGAYESFNYLLRNWYLLREDSNLLRMDKEKRKKIDEHLQSEWSSAVQGVEWEVNSAQEILGFLLPAMFRRLGFTTSLHSARLQGIGYSQYWLRVVNEEFDEKMVRDQFVLKEMYEWRSTKAESSSMIENLFSDPDYLVTWDHFAGAIYSNKPEDILILGDQILSRYRNPAGARIADGGATSKSGPIYVADPFNVIWKFAYTFLEPDDLCLSWIQEQIRRALPRSLSLVNDIYYFFAGNRRSIVKREGRVQIRRFVIDLCRESIRSGGDILRICHPALHFCVFDLVYPRDSEGELAELNGGDSWKWLGEILLDALRIDPNRMALSVAALINISENGEVAGQIVHRVDTGRMDTFFGINAKEVIEIFESASANFQDKDQLFLKQLVRSSRSADPTSSS